MNHDDLMQILHRAYALPRGPERAALLAQAVEGADDLGDERLQVDARVSLLDAYLWGGQAWKALAPFVWCLARLEERPDLFTPGAAHRVRWSYKSAVNIAARNPAVALEQVRALMEGMETFYREQGAAMHTVHGQFFWVARTLGRLDEARGHLEAWRATPRDDSSDCEACEAEHEVAQAIADGDDELAVAMAAPVLRGEKGCPEQPEKMQGHVLPALLRTGRVAAAWDAHVRSYRVLRRAPRHANRLENHLTYLAWSGRTERGLRILRRHAAWTAQCEGAGDLWSMTLGATVLLHQAVREGRGQEVLGVEMPESTLWCPGHSVPATATLAQAAAACETWNRALAAAYDKRNGNTYWTTQLEEALAQRLQVLGPHSGTGVELLGDTEPLPQALGSEPEPAAGVASSASTAPGADRAGGTEDYAPVEIPVLAEPASLVEALDRLVGPGSHPEEVEAGFLVDWLESHGVLAAPAPEDHEIHVALARAAVRGAGWDYEGAFDERRRARALLAQADLPAGMHLWRRARMLRCDLLLVRDARQADLAAGRQGHDDHRYEDLLAQVDELVAQTLADLDDGQGARAAAGAQRVEALLTLMGLLGDTCGVRETLEGPRQGLEVMEQMADIVARLAAAGGDPEGRYAQQLEARRALLEAMGGDIYGAARAAEELMRRHSPCDLGAAVDARTLLGWLSSQAEQPDEAVEQFTEASNLLLAAGRNRRAVNILENLANALGAAGRFLEAAEVLETGIDLAQDAGWDEALMRLRGVLIRVLPNLEEHAGVVEVALPLAAAYEERGRTGQAAEVLEQAAVCCTRIERSDQAAELFERSAGLYPSGPGASDGDRVVRARLLRRAALAMSTQPSIEASRQRRERAVDLIEQARALLEAVPSQGGYSADREFGLLDRYLADVLWRCDDNAAAIAVAQRAAEEFLAGDALPEAVREHAFIARIHAESREVPGELEAARAALATGRELLARSYEIYEEQARWLDDVEAYINRDEDT